jgi:hypothetical protein
MLERLEFEIKVPTNSQVANQGFLLFTTTKNKDHLKLTHFLLTLKSE